MYGLSPSRDPLTTRTILRFTRMVRWRWSISAWYSTLAARPTISATREHSSNATRSGKRLRGSRREYRPRSPNLPRQNQNRRRKSNDTSRLPGGYGPAGYGRGPAKRGFGSSGQPFKGALAGRGGPVSRRRPNP